MSTTDARPNALQLDAALIGRFGAWGDLEVSGDANALRRLAAEVRRGEELSLSLLIPETPPTPYSGYLADLHICPSDAAVVIVRNDRTLVVRGRKDYLDIFAATPEFLANQADESPGERHHLHVEYFPGHFYLDPESEPLVIAALSVR